MDYKLLIELEKKFKESFKEIFVLVTVWREINLLFETVNDPNYVHLGFH